MSRDPYAGDPFADAETPEYDEGRVVYPGGITDRSLGGVRAAAARERMSDALDVAIRSPRWDQVRGLVMLSVGLVVALGVGFVLIGIVVAGAAWWIQRLMEVVS